MTKSPCSCTASPNCRLEWRPSRWLCACLVSLGLMAGVSVLASDMSGWLAWPCAFLVVGLGVRQALAEWRRPPLAFVFEGPGRGASVQGRAVGDVQVQWRGGFAFASWRGLDGRMHRVSWWPDTLPGSIRRELRLATGPGHDARQPRQMAP